jgi:hypothetical protein
MKAEMLTELRLIMRGELKVAKPAEGVTVTPVATSKTSSVTPVTPVTPNFEEGGNANSEGEAAADRTRPDDAGTAIEERAGLAADRVSPVYLDAWARLNHQKPFDVTEAQWRQAVGDGGLFLDARGSEAAETGWTPGELFDVTAGLIWLLAGASVVAIGADHAPLERWVYDPPERP